MNAEVDTLAPLVVTLVVRCPPAAAFRYFVEDIGQWWPLATHSVGRDASTTCVFEGGAGGRLVERTRDGETHTWGTVTAWDPPRRLTFTWHPGRPAQTAQRVDVRFTATPEGTAVTLTHDGWEALGARAGAMRDEYGNGWQAVLRERFAGHVRRAMESST